MSPITTYSVIEARTTPEPNTGCWLWMGGIAGGGYGALRHGGKMVLAHRFSWEAHNGAITSGLLVCHRCDNPPCVNPDHLFLGTYKDNYDDMARKGRGYQHPPVGTLPPLGPFRNRAGFLSDTGARLLLSMTARR